MAELERELADLLDEAPLLPEDDDEGSGIDFVPPPELAARPASTPPHAGSTPPPDAVTPPDPVTPPDATLSAATAAKPAQAVGAPPALPAPALAEPSARTAVEEKPKVLPPATGKGARALVTTLVVAAILVVGRIVTWQPGTPDAHGPRAESSTSLAATATTIPALEPTAPALEPTAPALEPTAPALEPTARVTPSAALPETPPGEPSVVPVTAPPFSVVDMLTALAPTGIEAGRCRHTGEKPGRAYVRVNIAAGGSIDSVFAGHAYKDSETAACIERKIRAAKLPAFSGNGGSVVLPVDLR